MFIKHGFFLFNYEDNSRLSSNEGKIGRKVKEKKGRRIKNKSGLYEPNQIRMLEARGEIKMS